MARATLSAGLHTALHALDAHGRSGLVPLARSLGLVTVTEPARAPRAVVFLRLADAAAVERVRAAGVELNEAGAVGPDVVRTGIAPLTTLPEISTMDGVDQLAVARRLRPLMDVAPGKVGVGDLVRTSALTGDGVVIGVVDTGIDAAHPAFAGRIHRVWDQTLRGPGVPEGHYGVELSGGELPRSRDTHGHGTHVAGIATGADPAYPGIAPGARLVVVRTSLLDAHIADGVRYCLRVARDLGAPCVVNLSLGGHADAHDGTDGLSQIIDAESGPGRIVVCAAGNEGDDAIHARLAVPDGESRSIPWSGAGPVELNVWYPGADRLDVAVAGPSGASTPWQEVRTAGSPVGQYRLPDGIVHLTTPGPDPVNGDHHVLVLVEPSAHGPEEPAPPRPTCTWRLRLRRSGGPPPAAGAAGRRTTAAGAAGPLAVDGAPDATGPVDAWLLSDPDTPAAFTGRHVADTMKVGSPGAATAAMTAAAYTTRTDWTDVDGDRRRVGLDLDDIASFSSEGPRRDGHPKPDVAAPGAMIVSALSGDANLQRAFVVDARHAVLAGTSMASPFLAGLVALLLQRDPTLDPERVRAALRAAAGLPGREAGDFDRKWGYGLVRADRLV